MVCIDRLLPKLPFHGTEFLLSSPPPRHTLTDSEKSDYLQAEKCLMSSPAKLGTIEGAENRWDELQWAHIYQSNVIHGVGDCKLPTFFFFFFTRYLYWMKVRGLLLTHYICIVLPWHRYYVRVHELLLQTECNYTGAQPYWDEQLDADASEFFLLFLFSEEIFLAVLYCQESMDSFPASACLDSIIRLEMYEQPQPQTRL